jgi:hypothetical protein
MTATTIIVIQALAVCFACWRWSLWKWRAYFLWTILHGVHMGEIMPAEIPACLEPDA